MEITLEVEQVYALVTILDLPALVVYAGESVGGIKKKNALWFCDAGTYGTTYEHFHMVDLQNIVDIKHVGRLRKWYEFWQPRVVLFANQ